MKTSFLTDLTCSNCNKSFSAEEVQTFCLSCNAPLISNYDLNAVREHVDRDEITKRNKGMWRWHELLPVREPENMVTLGEGDAATLHLTRACLLYTSDAADERSSVDLGGRRIIKKKKTIKINALWVLPTNTDIICNDYTCTLVVSDMISHDEWHLIISLCDEK